jgi:pyruvate/2-oxoglutarate dehydrogenase complex dihydrolipoamide acyltransferase (E2) component
MKDSTRSYQVVDLTPRRRAWLNILDLPRPTHPMYGLLEVDVTTIREFIAGHKARTGESLSFTGYLAFCLARAVEEYKEVQTYRRGNRQLALFDEVDVGLMIERQSGEKRVLSGYVVRDASQKTYREIHQEIRSAQSTPMDPSEEIPRWFLSAMLLPWPFSRLVKALLGWATRRNPTIPVSMAGTVGITSVGMFSKGHSGWGFEVTRHSLDLVVGSITWKPAVVEGGIEPREILNLTLVFDHDVIDGAPAARFTRRLVGLIESGYGLDEGDNRRQPATNSERELKTPTR